MMDACGGMTSRGIGFATSARQKKLSISADKHAQVRTIKRKALGCLTYRPLCVPPQKRSLYNKKLNLMYCYGQSRGTMPPKVERAMDVHLPFHGGFQVPFTTTTHSQRGLTMLRNRCSKNPVESSKLKTELPTKKKSQQTACQRLKQYNAMRSAQVQ